MVGELAAQVLGGQEKLAAPQKKWVMLDTFSGPQVAAYAMGLHGPTNRLAYFVKTMDVPLPAKGDTLVCERSISFTDLP